MIKFSKGTALLVTSQITQRSGLRKSLLDIGIDNQMIEVAGDFEQAKDRLSKGPVNLLITDDDIGGNHSGMELMDLHQKNNPTSSERIFIIMINGSSPFFMAEFSLKGGDTILNTPFTNEAFVSNLTATIMTKENLSSDELLALDIQDAIKVNDIDKACSLLADFRNHDSLQAIYSSAVIHEAKDEFSLAFDEFSQVVKLHVDFKSLVSLVRIGPSLQKHLVMLEYIELWLVSFPLHHDSILDITRIILANKKFELLDEIFEMFAKFKITENFAKIPIAAGFVMASAYHLENNRIDKTKNYALKAIEYSCRKMPIIYKALEVLMQSGEEEEAEKAYERLAIPVFSIEEKIIDIKIKNIIFPKTRVLIDCYKLLQQKVLDPDLYQITINCLRHIGKDPQEMINVAKKAFPGTPFQ